MGLGAADAAIVVDFAINEAFFNGKVPTPVNDSDDIPMVTVLTNAVTIPAFGVNPIWTAAVVPRPTICGLNVPNGSAARLSLLLWMVNCPYCSNATVDPKPTALWCITRLSSLYSTVPSLVAMETMTLADLGLNNWYWAVSAAL